MEFLHILFLTLLMVMLSMLFLSHHFSKTNEKIIYAYIYLLPLCFLMLVFTANVTGADAAVNPFGLASLLSFLAYFGLSFVLCHKFIDISLRPYSRVNAHFCVSLIFAIVMNFAFLYSKIYLYLPESFAGVSTTSPFDQSIDFIYFSIVTFATVGYGDVMPQTSWAKIAVSAEILVAFLIVFVSVSLFSKKNEGDRK